MSKFLDLCLYNGFAWLDVVFGMVLFLFFCKILEFVDSVNYMVLHLVFLYDLGFGLFFL